MRLETELTVSDVSASGGLGKTRIEALADGIFAIAMTLMVFDIKLPTGGNPAKPESRTDPALASIPGVHDQLHHAGCLSGGTSLLVFEIIHTPISYT